MFQVNQMVVCVSDRVGADLRPSPAIMPERGRVYTIRQFDPLPLPPGIRPGIALCEIHNPPAQYSNGFGEPHFGAWQFRPIREQSIEIFRGIARGVREPEKERV